MYGCIDGGDGLFQENANIPKYIQIADDLRKIVQQAAKEGKDKFLSDEQLIKKYNVSRMTIRQAVQMLVDEGMLKRVQGKGTFIVHHDKLKTDIAKLDSFFRGWYLAEDFKVELLYRGVVPCPDEIAEQLGLESGEDVYQVKRLRKSKGVPIVVDNRYLRVEYGEKVSDEEYINYSFSHIFLKKFGWTFSEGEIEIEAILANEEIAETLKISEGAPILYRKVQLKMKDLGCVLAGDSCYRGDMYKYKSVIKSH